MVRESIHVFQRLSLSRGDSILIFNRYQQMIILKFHVFLSFVQKDFLRKEVLSYMRECMYINNIFCLD